MLSKSSLLQFMTLKSVEIAWLPSGGVLESTRNLRRANRAASPGHFREAEESAQVGGPCVGGWPLWRWLAPVEVAGPCVGGWPLWWWVAPVEVGGTALVGGTVVGGWHGSVLVPYTLMRRVTLNGGILLRISRLPRIGYAGSAEESHVAALCLHR